MHQTVREFFFRPHDAVNQSKFAEITNEQDANNTIQTTCIRYLNLHYKEISQTSQAVCDEERQRNFVKYLETRPLIKYSLEWLRMSEKETAQEALRLLSESVFRTTALEYCLLKQLDGSNTDSANSQHHLNELLAVAAKEGYAVAVGNVLAAGAAVDTKFHGLTALHLAARGGHDKAMRVIIIEGRANVEVMSSEGWTALHYAALAGH